MQIRPVILSAAQITASTTNGTTLLNSLIALSNGVLTVGNGQTNSLLIPTKPIPTAGAQKTSANLGTAPVTTLTFTMTNLATYTVANQSTGNSYFNVQFISANYTNDQFMTLITAALNQQANGQFTAVWSGAGTLIITITGSAGYYGVTFTGSTNIAIATTTAGVIPVNTAPLLSATYGIVVPTNTAGYTSYDVTVDVNLRQPTIGIVDKDTYYKAVILLDNDGNSTKLADIVLNLDRIFDGSDTQTGALANQEFISVNA